MTRTPNRNSLITLGKGILDQQIRTYNHDGKGILEMSFDYDVAVIGGGPAGYAAAGRAAQLGMKPVIIEKAELGGICLNWGCIPTKALLESAHGYRFLQHAANLGLRTGQPDYDFPGIIERSRKISDRMSKGIQFLMKQRGVEVINGVACLRDGETLEIDLSGEVRRITAERIVIATGARPAPLPGIDFDGELILNSTDAMTQQAPPPRMIVIGAGAIGMEFADFYNAFGTKVTIVEMMSSVLPNEDEEIVKELNRTLRRKKIDIHVSTRVTGVQLNAGTAIVSALSPKGAIELVAEKVLVAIGVRPNVENLGLEALGVEFQHGFIKVNDRYESSVPGVYAIGDVAGPPMLAHKASMEAVCCINGIAGHGFRPMDYQAIPGCTYCHPQVSSIGLTERSAGEKGLEVVCGVFPFRANGRSIAMDETDGIVKLVFAKPGLKLVGAHILHAMASELIAELALALRMGATASDIASAIHAHPTLAEAVMEAAGRVLGEAIHI